MTHPWLVHICGVFLGTREGGRTDADEAGLLLFSEAVALTPDDDLLGAWLQLIAGGFPPEDSDKNMKWARETSAAMRSFMSGAAYVNYLGADAGTDAVRSAYGPSYERLVALKDRYDPDNVFRLNQNIRPTRGRA